MKFKSLFLIFFIIVLMSVSVSAIIQDYAEIGGSFQDYNIGRDNTVGIWNQFIGSDFSTTSVPLTDSAQVPLVADLNNDGVNEIVVFDNSFIKIFHNRTLTGVASFALETGSYSNMLLFDIDGDSQKEIIIYKMGERFPFQDPPDKMFILSFNGTDINNQTTFSNPSIINDQSPTDAALINCQGVDDCMLVGVVANTFLKAMNFDSTSIENSTVTLGLGFGTDSVQCFPIVPKLVSANLGAGDRYIFTTMKWQDTSSGINGDVQIYVVDGTVSPPVLDFLIDETRPDLDDAFLSANCGRFGLNDVSQRFTAPLVANIDGSPGLEIVIATQVNVAFIEEFKMFSYNSQGFNIDDYPEIVEAQGTIVSNVMLANAFSDTGEETSDTLVDFCVLGYSEDEDKLDLLCASEFLSEFLGLGNSDEFFFDTSGSNLTNLRNISHSVYKPIVHAVQVNQDLTDGSNLNEFLTPFGTFSISGNNLNPLFSGFPPDGAVIPVDVEKVGFFDLLVLRDSNLFYVDDNFVNSQGQITSIEINPCIDAVWRLNTTVQVNVEVSDVDSDDVSARAILYETELNEQDSGFSVNASTGTTFTFSFIANETTVGSVLALSGRDIENADESPDTIDFTFRVENNGVEFGDCKTTQEIELTGVEAALAVDPDVIQTGTGAGTNLRNNSIVNFGNNIQNLTGIGIGIFWLILIAVGIFGIFEAAIQLRQSLMGAFALSALWSFIMLIIGTFLGFINPIIVIIITLALVGIVVIVVRNQFTSAPT